MEHLLSWYVKIPLAPNSLLGKQILGCTGISDLSVAISRGKSLSLELEVHSLSFGLLQGITDGELLVDSIGLGPTSLASDSEMAVKCKQISLLL